MTTPEMVPSRVKLPKTTPRNGPMVHPNDAMAYEIPNTNMDDSVRERPPRSSFGVANDSWKPNRSATPKAMSTNPITMPRYRATFVTSSPPARRMKPSTVNTARNPEETG